MLRLLLVALVALKIATPVAAQENSGAIQGVITQQIEAFRQDDFATAFSFASPMIKGIFGNPDRFGLMVRNGFPMVWRNTDVQFRDLKGEGTLYLQKVLVKDAKGVFHVLEYQMIETLDGWQINGVSLLEKPPVGA